MFQLNIYSWFILVSFLLKTEMLSIQSCQENISLRCLISPLFSWSGEMQGECRLWHAIQSKVHWNEYIVMLPQAQHTNEQDLSLLRSLLKVKRKTIAVQLKIVPGSFTDCLGASTVWWPASPRKRACIPSSKQCKRQGFQWLLLWLDVCLASYLEISRWREAADEFCCRVFFF